MKRKSLYKLMLLLLTGILFGTLALQAQESVVDALESSDSAWDALVHQDPELEDDRLLSAIDRRVLQVLSLGQVEAYLAGADPASLRLPNGESLAEYLANSERAESAGLIYKILEPCTLMDTRRSSNKFTADEVRAVRVRGESTSYEEEGGRADGCGIPGLIGNALQTNRARALFLDLEVSAAEGSGDLRVWPVGHPKTPEAAAVHYSLAPQLPQFKNSLIVSMCGEESLSPCREGDFRVQTAGAGAHVIVTARGYFESAAGLLKEFEGPTSADKSSVWSVDGSDIYYDSGDVGIGTTNPLEKLHVVGNIWIPESFSVGSGSVDGANAVAVGKNAAAEIGGSAFGYGAEALDQRSVALGNHAKALEENSVAIGHWPVATGAASIALGQDASASSMRAIALGRRTEATGRKSLAIGAAATSNHRNSVALGVRAKTTADNQFVFGNAADGHDAVFYGVVEAAGFKFPDGTVQTTAGGSPNNCQFVEVKHAIPGPRDTFCPGNRFVAGVRANEDSDNNAILTHLYCCEL